MSQRKRAAEPPVPEVADEFEKIDLGDERLNSRAKTLAALCAKAPAESFPEIAGSRSELELAYRFFSNSRVSADALLEPHVRATVGRIEAARTALVVHDTSEVHIPGEQLREGLSWFSKNKQGFLLHAALALSADGSRQPLGLLGALRWVRERGGKKSGPEYEATKESRRWFQLAEAAGEAVGGRATLIHVMDREGDSYELFALLLAAEHRFVIRLCHDRQVLTEEAEDSLSLREAIGSAKILVKRKVVISRRSANKRKRPPRAIEKFGPRDARTASVVFKAMPLTIKRPTSSRRQGEPESIQVTVVQVVEPTPPPGAEPVEWLLVTTEPVKTAKDAARIVDYYRARWTIEEFFKALKTGCAYETRQLETHEALDRALMLFLPIAWRLLLLRTVARTDPNATATTVLSETEIEVLRTRQKLPASPTARDVLLAVARLGGHLSNNGDPGWLVIARGMDKLLLLAEGWNARATHT